MSPIEQAVKEALATRRSLGDPRVGARVDEMMAADGEAYAYDEQVEKVKDFAKHVARRIVRPQILDEYSVALAIVVFLQAHHGSSFQLGDYALVAGTIAKIVLEWLQPLDDAAKLPPATERSESDEGGGLG